jgi:prophage antirepressor-like protein
MMGQVLSYDFETNAVRVVMVEGEPWFVAVDVCRVLEIKNSRDALARLDDDEKGVGISDTLGGKQTVNTVNESGLFALIFTSNKPAAKRFRKWVTSEVLPAIRRDGAYVADGAVASDDDNVTLGKDEYIELLLDQNSLFKLMMMAKPKKPRKPAVPLTSAEKAKIISMFAAGMGVNEIARETGRSSSMISLLRNGFTIINGGNA